ncbi:MAG: NIPSNAP family protein [Thermoguttaceae bacterium]|nr:NIPSNAP family protein [Thermoguttaceae bacterium]MDW8078593.1 NIPSNAP family protein [Thermoguttaceae bacterium]
MKRRDFLATSAIFGTVGTVITEAGQGVMAQGSGLQKEFYELREYRLASLAKRDVWEKFYAEVAIPALNRLGLGPIGAFKLADDSSPNLWVLIPHATLETVVTLADRLLADRQFVERGAAVLQSPPDDPPYLRMESTLLWAFDHMPKLAIPAKGPERILQLRIYESATRAKNKKKIEMFNEGGEIRIFLKTGLTPVFFGEAIIGPRMPNLTYMLGFETKAEMDSAWKRFLEDPEWLKLKGDPQYKDTVSNITNLLLRPAQGSQI